MIYVRWKSEQRNTSEHNKRRYGKRNIKCGFHDKQGISGTFYGAMQGFIAEAMETGDADKVSLVVTAPPLFSINARTTMNVMQSLIGNAERNILITGYSLSSYFLELVDTIIQKSQRGVFVKFFVNNLDKQPEFEKILRYKGRFLKVYNYRQEDDKMSALHAKVISVDQKQTLITSANLSYHGQQGNIELGTLIESKQIAKQIEDFFTKLIFSKVFEEV